MKTNYNSALSKLQDALGYQFKQIELLEQALTHRSKDKNNNERLEFLGDALLETIISDVLFRSRPNDSEGNLTRLRATMVRGQTLAEIADSLALKNYIRVGSGELRTGGYQRKSTLADAFEAIIAAIYLDSKNFDVTYQTVRALFEQKISKLPDANSLKDPKTKLQEYLQSQNKEKPTYTLIDVSGPDHDKVFMVCCKAYNLEVTATKSSKKKAEQASAEKLLTQLDLL